MNFERFETKKEAEERANERTQKESPKELCPLIRGTCNKECVCFQPYYAHAASKDGPYYVYGFVCNNAMFSEYRTCQN